MRQFLNSAIAILFLCSMSACSWHQFGHYHSTEIVPNKSSLRVQPVWHASVGSGGAKKALQLQAAVNANAIYTADRYGHVIATDRQSGKRLWQQNVRSEVTSGPSVANGMVIVATNKSQLFALNAANGKPLWRTNLPNVLLAAPTIAKSNVIVSTVDGKLLAYSSQDGKKRWEVDHGAPLFILRGGSAPIVLGNKIIAGFADGKLAIYKLSDGALLWQQTISLPDSAGPLGEMIDIVVNPKVSDGIIYIANYQGAIAAIAVKNGHSLWRHKLSAYSGLVLSSDAVYVSDADSSVWAFDRLTGRVLWQQKKLIGKSLTAPSLLGNYVVVADKRGFSYWLSQSSGRIDAAVRVASQAILAKPAIYGKSVYFLTNNGDLIAYKQSA